MNINKVGLIIVIMFLCIYYLIVPNSGFSPFLFDSLIVIVLVALSIFFYESQSNDLKGHWIKPSYILVISYLAVNLQYILDYRLGIKDNSSSVILNPLILNQCAILAVIGLCSFTIGYQKSVIRNNSFVLPNISLAGVSMFLKFLQFVLFGLFIVNINIYEFIAGNMYMGGERESTMADYFEAMLTVVNALIIVGVVNSEKEIYNIKSYIKAFPLGCSIIITLYLLMRLMSGDRGPFMYTVILLFFGYIYTTRKKYNILLIIGLALLGSVSMSLVGIARGLDTSSSFTERIEIAFDKFSTSGRFENRGEKSIFPPTEELGFSFLVNQVLVNEVENNNQNFRYGKYTFFSFANSIPFVPGLLSRTLNVPQEDQKSSGLANKAFFGEKERTWGIGSTMLADFYMEFGVFGVILGMFLCGMLFRYIDDTIIVSPQYTVSSVVLLFCLLHSSKAIYIPRSTMFAVMREFVWGYIFLFINTFIYKNNE